MNLFRKVDLQAIKEGEVKQQLKKTLGAFDLTMLSIGAIIGVGAFVLTGQAAANYSGPAVVVSYFLAAIVCILTGLLYLELASVVPSSGSSYSYAYASMGEMIAWIVFWFMMMEYTTGSALIALGWGSHINGILASWGVIIPEYLTKSPFEGGIINVTPMFVVLILSSLLIKGTKESSLFNITLVIVKILAIILFIIFALPYINTANWDNFLPYGYKGLMTGTATLILSYVGFDTLASATQECKNPRRDLPIAIIVSLLICALIYMSLSAALTLIVPYDQLNNAEPMAYALRLNNNNWGATIVAFGAVAGITTSLIVQLYGQSRIIYAIAHDGLVPKTLARVHKTYHTPHISTIFVGVMVALFSGLVPLDFIIQLASIGTLVAFLTVAVGVVIFRRQYPDIKRFKCPAVWVIAPLSFIICCFLLWELLESTWHLCAIWLLIGICFYFGYSYKNSNLNKKNV